VSLDFNTAFDQAKTIAEPALQATVEDLKGQFLKAFGELKDAVHKDKIEKIFKEAAQTKIKAIMAKTPEEQRTLARVYELKVMVIETYVLSAKIVADAKAASLFKEMMKQVLDTLGVVAMNILKTVVTGLISGAIAGLTGGAGGPLAAAAVSAVGAVIQPKPPT
jgi:hypothetical protein